LFHAKVTHSLQQLFVQELVTMWFAGPKQQVLQPLRYPRDEFARRFQFRGSQQD
jgi:hypothetical protein